MFKSRIKAWKLTKNLRPDEVLAMARVQARRDAKGIPAEFWRHGRVVRPDRIERFLSNHPHVVTKLRQYVPADAMMRGRIEALLPPHIVVLAPMTPLQFDDQLHSAESIIVGLKGYLEACPMVQDRPQLRSFEYLASSMNMLASYKDRRGESRDASTRCLSATLKALEADVAAENPRFVPLVVSEFHRMKYACHLPELARTWVDYAVQSCIRARGQHHPWTTLLSGLARLPEDEVEGSAIVRILAKALRDLVQAQSQRDDLLLLDSHQAVFLLGRQMAVVDKKLERRKYMDFLRKACRHLRGQDLTRARLQIAWLYTEDGRYETALELLAEDQFGTKARFQLLMYLAKLHSFAQDAAQCRVRFESALHLYRCGRMCQMESAGYELMAAMENAKSRFPLLGDTERGSEMYEFVLFLEREIEAISDDLVSSHPTITLDGDETDRD